MKTLKFKCELISDVILNQKAATEGPNQTLDFIPGSNFLGIVAAQVYAKEPANAWAIIHSGKVRFGDAHPSQGGTRGLKVPASMFYPKLGKPSEELYIHHYTNHGDDSIRKKQLKQCRSGFYDFSDAQAVRIITDTNFAIKSAHDKMERRSKDEQMYGYQSLQKGLVLYFSVECDSDEYAKAVKAALVGEKRVGRSRTAQYGLVRISEYDFRDIPSGESKEGLVEVYADSRLIFIDQNGQSTFRPTAEQLGVKGGEILWEKSQIRTFQYAPWNYKRQCFDTDRCGIEKGSVIVVKGSQCPEQSQYVGSYRNEGFGKVIYNPEFLNAVEGKAKYKLSDDASKESAIGQKKELTGTSLLDYINEQKQKEKIENEVYEMVNKWVDNHNGPRQFKDEHFASQWGAIRSIAMRYSKKEELVQELYGKEDAYLTHGVAKDKWAERCRLEHFKDFVETLDDRNAQMAIINLASQMQKECSNKNN